ncbi:MAG: hypothetical protein HPY76_11825 [Anaerolineae bacterium]|nr:hypothetical protein [Anaerolineae bacterium]
MNRNMSKYAPFGWYLALIAAIGAVGYFIVKQTFDLPLQIMLGVIVLGIALAIIFDPQKIKDWLVGRQAKYSSNALVLVIAVLGIVVIINYIVNQNSPSWDLTEDNANTLAPELSDALQSLNQPLRAEAYFTQRYPSGTAEQLLDNMVKAGKGQFSYEFIDPEADPIRAQNAQVTRDGTIVFKLDDRSEQLTYVSEQEFLSAIIRLTNPGERIIYFLTGHGEYDPTGESDLTYSQFNQTLASKNYTVQKLNLISLAAVPENASAVVIAGPQQPLLESEIEAIKTYLSGGGSLVVFSEPYAVTGIDYDQDLLSSYLEHDWSILLGNDVIIDPNGNPPLVAIADSYSDHPITQKLSGYVTIFPTAHSVSSSVMPDSVSATILILTSNLAWGETDIASIEAGNPSFAEGADLIGPVPVAIASTNTATGARVVVVGDANFADDNQFTAYGNGDLAINIIDWVAEQENLISITPRAQTTRVLLPPGQLGLGLLLLGSVFVLPGLVIVGGVTTWLQRKRKG